MFESSGAKANKTGNLLELTVRQHLDHKNYTHVPAKNFDELIAQNLLNQPLYTTQALVGKTIYHTDRRCDFLIFHPQKWAQKLIIECKWQQSNGSVDEKFPFLVENIRLLKVPSLIIVDGGGHKPGAITWLKAQADTHLLHVLSLSEFMVCLNDGLF
ncbi:MAG: PD-(D/E)XK nuclease superfamily protein [Spirochaetia bacterium]